MALRTVVLSDFSGGLNNHSPEKIGPNEQSALQGFLHTEGNLRSWDGRTKLNATVIGTASTLVGGMFRFYRGATAYTLVSSAGFVWVDVSSNNTGDFRPIWFSSSFLQPIHISFAPVGNRLYMSRGDGLVTTSIQRWDGIFYKTGTATCAGSTTAVSGTNTLWLSSDSDSIRYVLPGDTIFFKPAGGWHLATPYTVKSVGSNTAITLTANGPNTGGAVDYIIARVHPAGISKPASSLTVTATAGTGLTAGLYKYKYTLANSLTGYESNPMGTAHSLTLSGGTSLRVNVTAIPTGPSDRQIDRLKVYRTKVNGSLYFLGTTLARSQATSTQFVSSYVDSVSDATISTTQLETNHDTPPTAIANVKEYNGRLYASGGLGNTNKLYFSNLQAFEYFPANQYTVVDPYAMNAGDGGFAVIGGGGNVVMDFIAEGGASAITGMQGDDLLVLTKQGGYRWLGYDWGDFQLVEAFKETCVTRFSAAKSRGLIFWVGKNGPVALQSGTNEIIPIYEKVFPTVSNPFGSAITAATSTVDYLQLVRGVVWRDWYIVAYAQTASTSNNRLLMYHIPTGTWTTLSHASNLLSAQTLSVWDGVVDNNDLYYGDAGVGTVWKLFSQTSGSTDWSGATGVACLARTGLASLAGKPSEEYSIKHIERMTVVTQRPSAAQTITCKVYTNARGTAGTTMSASVSGTAPSGRVYTDFAPAIDGRQFQFEVGGTFTKPLTVEGIELSYDVKDRTHGRNVG